MILAVLELVKARMITLIVELGREVSAVCQGHPRAVV